MGLSATVLCPGFVGAATPLAATPPSRQFAPSMSTEIFNKDGNSLTLDNFRGMPVLINFWATWCSPCVAELPAFDRAAHTLAGVAKILLVSVDRGGSKKALPFLHDLNIRRPHLAFDAKGALSREMGVRVLPTSFLLSADQRQSWVYVGPREWDSAPMIAEIRNLLRLAKASPVLSRQNNQDHLQDHLLV